MDATELKATLLALMRDDPDVRAVVVEVMREHARTSSLARATAPPPEPVFTGPVWLATKAERR